MNTSIFFFLRKTIEFTIVFMAVLVLVYFCSGYLCSESRMGTTIDKHQRLARLGKEKCILVGGSNLHYGMDSPLLEKETAREVVNMGIQGNIGLNYMLAEVAPSIEENDLIIVALEHTHFHKLSVDGENTLYRLLSTYPKGISYLNTRQLLRFPQHIGLAVGGNFKQIQNLLFDRIRKRQSFRSMNNVEGDYLGHKGKKNIYKPNGWRIDYDEVDEGIINILAEFDHYVRQQGAKMVMSFAPISQSSSNANYSQLIVDAMLKANLTVVGDIETYVYPDSFFFDTSHHLLYDKRSVRTNQLIADLETHEIY